MRTIKFRGLCTETKKFVFGDLIHGVGAKDGNMYILPNIVNLANIPHCDPLDGVKVIPETVGQFTGIYDDNDLEIYEGDIVRINKDHQSFGGENLHKVEYVSQSAKFHLIGTYFDNIAEGITDINGKNCCEVIGNIFDNPELL